MFTTEHFIWLLLCFIFIIIMSILSIKKKFSLKKAGYIMSFIGACSEISKIMSDMVESEKGGMHLDPTSLPFHLCSIMLYLCFFITFAKDSKIKKTIINFVAPLGTLGSFAALLIPTNGTDFTNILAYQCFVYHAVLLWFSIYLIVSKEAILNLKTYKTNLILLFCLAFFEIYINSALSIYDTNFLYLTRPPMNNLPILNLNHGWYVYFVTIICLGLIIITLFYLPFIIINRRNKDEF